MASVRLERVRKVYDKATAPAVVGLDLEVQDGEFVTLVGPSGCGKTTTLRMIAGLETVTSGRVFFDDDDVTGVPVQNRGISMVFQNYAIFPHMNVADNIGYGLRVAKVPAAQLSKRVQEVAELTGISELLDRYPRQLSGGQRQRVALARALARDPRTVLLDEPLSNLDAKLRDRTRAELKRLHRELGSTMIYVTHDQLEAITMSDRIAVMSEGELQQFGTPHAVFHRPANLFVAGFIGSPAINFFSGDLSVTGEIAAVTLETGLSIPIPRCIAKAAQRSAVTVGVRPQHVVLGGTIGSAWTVSLVESLGIESIVHLSRGATDTALAVCPDSQAVQEGENVRVQFPADVLLVFDADTGQAIRCDAMN